MDSINLLEELNLNDYYPQKLSFGVATTLREDSPQGCQKHYGLEIVRRLLMFDSTAVVSVTTEINKRIHNAGNKETKTTVTDEGFSDDVRSKQKNVATSSRRRKLNPMDLLIVVMNCCDDFLRQILIEKMFANTLSIPILLPDVRNGSSKPTLLLLALRSLVPDVSDSMRAGSGSMTLVDVRNPVVSFIRAGSLHRSKSKLVNYLLNFNSFDTFFHRDCPYGSVKRLVSNGSIEAAWFQSLKASEKEFNCRLFTALNLRGDARAYPKQTQFLCQSSTLVVFMVDSFKSFKELYGNVLKDVTWEQRKIIVCFISSDYHYGNDITDLDLWDDNCGRGIISAAVCDWNNHEKLNDLDFTSVLRETVSKFFKPELINSNQIPTYSDISRYKPNFVFLLDEEKPEYNLEKASAVQFIDSVFNLKSDCRLTMLPLQGEPWIKIGKLEREQRRTSQNKNNDEYYIAHMEKEKIRQREVQCRCLIQQNDIIHKFSAKFNSLKNQTLLYYLNYCKIKLDARSRVIISKLIEECKKDRQGNHPHRLNKEEHEMKLKKVRLEISDSAIGLEHILRECGQMYEAVISEEIRMREDLKNASVTPVVIRNFPTIVARLLLSGQPLELMDGDASNVPITWLKAVLNEIISMTSNAKVFALSIIGVQSSGKSTLLNALFGLQFPVSAGRCTRGIYCHLVPIDKGSLQVEYDYVLVVDTEGLGASELTGKSTFRDNELATFAIGSADATIINMKGENWADMTDILQIVAHGLIRVRKTKAQLDLMPRCMFVHQNVPAADAEERNWLGQETQLDHLDKAIKMAAREEGFTEITEFNQVINYDPELHSYYFPDLLSGSPPKATISQHYTLKANVLKQYLKQLLRTSSSKLTISGFFLRMSDLWNAMLYDDFVFSFRNTHDIISCTVLNDRISHEVDSFKSLNKLEQRKICESICSVVSMEELRTEKERILRVFSDALEKNYINMKVTLQVVIDATDICAALKKQHTVSLSVIKDEERHRLNGEIEKEIAVHMRKLEYHNEQEVKDLTARLVDLEKRIEEVERDNLNETVINEFEKIWQQLLIDNQLSVSNRKMLVQSKIEETIRASIKQLERKDKSHLETVVWSALFDTCMPLTAKLPQVTENDIMHAHVTRLVIDFAYCKSYVDEANSNLKGAYKKWESQFQNKKGLEFDHFHLEQILCEVGHLLGFSKKEASEVPSATTSPVFKSTSETDGTDEVCWSLPPGYSFTRAYIIGFIIFVCNYIYNRSLENSRIFISLTDPLDDIGERYLRSISKFRQISAEANVDAVSKQIFLNAERSFVKDLGELIKTEVCKSDTRHPTFKSKRAFLRTIITGLAQETQGLTVTRDEKGAIFKKFMLYMKMAESDKSEKFFHDAIMKLLKDVLVNECESGSQTDFQNMVASSVGMFIERVRNALGHAEANAKGCSRKYIQIFKDKIKEMSEIDFRIINLSGFTEAVVKKLNNLYADFLSKANSSFEKLVCEGDNAAIRTVLEKIMGCRERCPFCSAPCSQSLEKHAGDHRANHYPMGVGGTIDISGLFTDTQETHDATEELQGMPRTLPRKLPRKLAMSNCQAMVGTRVDIRTIATIRRATKWYKRNYHPFKRYKELAEYKDWDIPYSRDHNVSLYWKWFMAQFGKELAERYNALCPEIPETWEKLTLEEAIKSLAEL